MCGIVYAKNLKNNEAVNNLIKIQYEKQKERGYWGFGFLGMNKSEYLDYRSLEEKEIKKYLNGNPYDEILFHHRTPTSTKNRLNSTHPFLIEYEDKTYFFVHNGIIANDYELKEKHDKMKIKYISQGMDKKVETYNDSEALGIEFVLWLNQKIDTIKAVGSVAFICIEMNKDNQAKRMFFYRNNGNPLNLFKDKGLMMLSSEGAGVNIQEDNLMYYKYSDQTIKDYYRQFKIPVYFSFNEYENSLDDRYDSDYEYKDINDNEYDYTKEIYNNRYDELYNNHVNFGDETSSIEEMDNTIIVFEKEIDCLENTLLELIMKVKPTKTDKDNIVSLEAGIASIKLDLDCLREIIEDLDYNDQY